MPKKFKEPKAPEIIFRDYENESPFIWTINNILLPKNAKWKFEDRQWQIDIFDDRSPKTVTIKPTQIGLTIINTCKYLYFAIKHASRLMYTLPRQDDVTDLVNSRVDEIIRSSPILSNKLGDIDNVRMKKLGDSYLHFMESSVPPRMLDVDYLVNDEVDLSNQDHLEQYIARLDASEFKEHHRLSTPTIHGFGIHSLYDLTDKKEWFIKCPRCNEEFVLDWDVNVRHENNKTWYCCAKCDRVLSRETIQDGKWVSTANKNSDISGYSVSQMMCTYISPDKLWAESERMNPKNFYNLRLGRPYTPTVGALERSQIFNKCFLTGHKRESFGKGYFIGCDQGNKLHVVVGRQEEDTVKIVHMEVIEFEDGFERLGQLINMYNAKFIVLDGLPNRHSAVKLISDFPNRGAVAFYTSVDSLYKHTKNDQVNINKTDIFDYLQDKIEKEELQFYGQRNIIDPMTRMAIKHLANMRRDEVVQNTRIGGERTVIAWVNTGDDHFAHAIAYLLVAVDIGGHGGFKIRTIGSSIEGNTEEEDEPYNKNPYANQRGLKERFKRRFAF